MGEEKMLKIQEVAVLMGCATKTIDMWYAWAKRNPEHELAKILPKPLQESERGLRLWKYSDIYKLTEFQAKLPKGRNGILGDVTQKAWRNAHNFNKKEKE
jgi:hypothetical protein